MKKIVLTYIGEDNWSNKVFEDAEGQIFKDISCGIGKMEICTVLGGIDGDPNTLIDNIPRYKGLDIEIIGLEEEPTEEEKHNYRMLGRLKSDCDSYLGYGNRNEDRLWASSVKEQISKMKKLHNWFPEDKKPEWLTWDEIIEYENRMIA